MTEDHAHALAALPGGLRSVVGQRLDRDEEVVQALVLDGDPCDPSLADHNPSWGSPHALVITDRQLVLVSSGPPHLPATVEAAVLRLACRREAIAAIEVGYVLLRAWLTVTYTTRGALRDVRVPVDVRHLDVVRAAVRAIVAPTAATTPPAPHARGVVDVLPSWMRREVAALCWPGEQASVAIHAPPREQPPRGWWRRGPATPEQPIHSLVVTEARLLCLEQPSPVTRGGLRLGLVARVWALDALDEVSLEAAGAQPHATLRLGIRRDGAGRTYDVTLEPAQESQWRTAVEAVLALRGRRPVPLEDDARRRFVTRTGLGDVTLTEPTHYTTLLRHVEDHQRLLAAHGSHTTVAGAARHWRHAVYEPAVARLRASRAPVRLPDRTLADLYVRLCEHKWLVSERVGADIGLDAALEDFERWSA